MICNPCETGFHERCAGGSCECCGKAKLYVGKILTTKYPIYKANIHPPIMLVPAGENIRLDKFYPESGNFEVRWVFPCEPYPQDYTFIANPDMILKAIGGYVVA